MSAGNIFLFGFIAGATSQITRSGYLGSGSGSRTSLPWFISHIICLFFFSFSTPLIPNRRISRGCVVYCESLCKQKWKQKTKKKDKKENFTCCRSCRPYPPPPSLSLSLPNDTPSSFPPFVVLYRKKTKSPARKPPGGLMRGQFLRFTSSSLKKISHHPHFRRRAVS